MSTLIDGLRAAAACKSPRGIEETPLSSSSPSSTSMGDLSAALSLSPQHDNISSGSSGDTPTRISRSNKWKRRGVNISSPGLSEAELVEEGAELSPHHWSAAIAAAAAASDTNLSTSLPKSLLSPTRAFPLDDSMYGRQGLSEAELDLRSSAPSGVLLPHMKFYRGGNSEEESGNEHDEYGVRSPRDMSSGAESGKHGASLSAVRFQRKKEKREYYNRLMELLFKNDLLITEAICSSVLRSIEDEVDIILPEIVRYMLSTQIATEVIVRLIRAEVLRAVDEGTILRGNEPTSVMLTAHAKIVGHSFLRHMLKPEISLLCDEINQHKVQIEIDPAKLKAKGDVNAIIQENTNNLINVASRFLDRIKSCVELFPSQIRYIASEMRQCLQQRFPSTTVDSVLGGYIFLRLICPIIVSPASAGLSSDDDGFYLKDGILQKDTIRISPDAQRGLILLSKLLQQLANGTEFGWKEAYMIPLNPFLKQSRPIIASIFEAVSTPSPTPFNDDAVALEKGEIHLIKFIFHKLIHLGMDDIESFVREREQQQNAPTARAQSSETNVPFKANSMNATSDQNEGLKLVDELKQILRVLGKPPRSLRKYHDIVFYDNKDHSADITDIIKNKDGKSPERLIAKKLKKMKKKMKKSKKKKEDEERTQTPGLGRSGIVRRGTKGRDEVEQWRSDSCGKVKVLERTSSKAELRGDNSIVRRVRSSEKATVPIKRSDGSGDGGSGATTATDTEDAEEIRETDEDVETGSDFDFDESDDEWEKIPMPLSARPTLEIHSSGKKDETTRKRAEMAKKLLEEKYKSYSARNLRAERESMKMERNKNVKKTVKSKKVPELVTPSSPGTAKREGRSVTLTDLQVVKREQENEVLRRTGGLSPRGRNLTSPPSQHQTIEQDSDSSSDSSSDEESGTTSPPERVSPVSKKGGKLSRIPILRIPVRDDFKFLSPRRSSNRKDEASSVKHS